MLYHLICKGVVTEPSVPMHHAFGMSSLTTSRLLIMCRTSRHRWKHCYLERSLFVDYMDHKHLSTDYFLKRFWTLYLERALYQTSIIIIFCKNSRRRNGIIVNLSNSTPWNACILLYYLFILFRAGLEIRGCLELRAPLNSPAAPSNFCREPKDVLFSIQNTFR